MRPTGERWRRVLKRSKLRRTRRTATGVPWCVIPTAMSSRSRTEWPAPPADTLGQASRSTRLRVRRPWWIQHEYASQTSMMLRRRVPASSARWRRLPVTQGLARRSAHSTTLASTTPCGATDSRTPAAFAACSLKTSTSQLWTNWPNRCCLRPPRQTSVSTVAGTTGWTPRAIARLWTAHIRSAPSSTAMSAPAS